MKILGIELDPEKRRQMKATVTKEYNETQRRLHKTLAGRKDVTFNKRTGLYRKKVENFFAYINN
jgi:hypothetical protein